MSASTKNAICQDPKKQKRAFNFCLQAAQHFADVADPTEVLFIPCYPSPDSLKKLPCKGIAKNWQHTELTAEHLEQFKDVQSLGYMTIVSVLLKSHFLVFDCDSPEASNLFDSKWLPLLGDKPSFTVQSGREGHKAVFYKQDPTNPLVLAEKLRDPDCLSLEIRTGDNYQAIAGLHPSGSFYRYTQDLPIEELTPEAYKALKLASEGVKTVNESSTSSNSFVPSYLPQNNELVLFQEMLYEALNAGLEWASPEFYDQWLKVGMALHHASDFDLEDGLKTWIDWSRHSSRHDASEVEKGCQEKWEKGFDVDCDNPLTLGTFYQLYRDYQEQKQQSQEATKQEKKQPIQDADLPVTLEELQAYSEYHKTQNEAVPFDYETILNPFGLEGERKKSLFTMRMLDYASIPKFDFGGFFFSFLATYAAILPKRYKLKIWADFAIPPVLFVLMIQPAGGGKGVLKSPFTAPLEAQAIEQWEFYKTELTNVEGMRAAYEQRIKADPNGAFEEACQMVGVQNLEDFEGSKRVSLPSADQVYPLPSPPKPIVMKDTTPEKINKRSSEDKLFGKLWTESEFLRQLGSIVRYGKSTNGDSYGNTFITQLWDAESTQRERMSETVPDIDYYQVSIISGLTEASLKKNFTLSDDVDGLYSRLIWIRPFQISRPNTGTPEPDFKISDLFSALVKTTQAVIIPSQLDDPGRVYLDETSRKLLSLFDDQCEEQRQLFAKTNPGFSSWISRLPSQAYRICLVLHSLFYALRCHDNLNVVDYRVTKAALSLCAIANSHAKVLYDVVDDAVDVGKAKIFEDVLDSCLRWKNGDPVPFSKFGNRTIWKRSDVKEYYCSDYARKKDTTKALQKTEVFKLWQEMSERGYGVFDAKLGTFTPNQKRAS